MAGIPPSLWDIPRKSQEILLIRREKAKERTIDFALLWLKGNCHHLVVLHPLLDLLHATTF
jgi:hypothetical protein